MSSFIDDMGVERFLGNQVPTMAVGSDWKVYGDVSNTPMYSRSQWPELILAMGNDFNHPYLPYIRDQDGIGQCNADATANAISFQRKVQLGPDDNVRLCAGDLYDQINGGSDRGSLLEDGLRKAMEVGVGTEEDCGGTNLWKRPYKRATPEQRKKYRVLEAFLCPTFDHCMSAVISGRSLISGIMWYSNYNPDVEGWLPNGRGSAGGHAIMGFKPAMREVRGVLQFGIRHVNSWTLNWGFKGMMVIPEPAYEGQVGGWWAVRSVTDEGSNVPPPK